MKTTAIKRFKRLKESVTYRYKDILLVYPIDTGLKVEILQSKSGKVGSVSFGDDEAMFIGRCITALYHVPIEE